MKTLFRKGKWPVVLVFAVIINLLIFGLVPILSGRNHEIKIDLEPARAVALTDYRPYIPPTKSTPKEVKEDKKIPEIKKFRLEPKKPKPQVIDPNLTTPELDIKLKPTASLGIVIQPPPPKQEKKKPKKVKEAKRSNRPSEPEKKQKASAGQLEKAPRLVNRIPPKYPYTARKRGISGEVLVRMLIDSDGRVKHVNVLRSHPPGVFENSVKQALVKWEFEPGQLGGQAVSIWVTQRVRFTLAN